MRSEADERTAAGIRIALIFFGGLIGVTTVIGSEIIHSMYTGRELSLADSSTSLLFETVIAALPFLVMAVIGIRKLFPWVIGLLLTIVFWGYALYDTLAHWGTGRGVNIGLGLAFYLSPIIISAVCLIAARQLEKRQIQ